MMPPDFGHVRRACEDAGFAVRGALRCEASDAVPGPGGAPAAALVLVDLAGRDGFAKFRAAPEWAQGGDALDRFTERVLDTVATDLVARALYPHRGPPWWPFQRWAQRAEPVHPSPLGLLVHPRLGLWHAYRGALAFDAPLRGMPPREAAPSPCVGCPAPCLDACPVDAFGAGGYDVGACAAHLAGAAGAPCLAHGCRARDACPVGAAHRYAPEQVRFHMRAFARAVATPVERGGPCGAPRG